MQDYRIEKLAKVLVRYSTDLKKGEKILIEAHGIDSALIKAIIKEVYAVGGYPFVNIVDASLQRALISGADENMLDLWRKFDAFRMEEMDAYIGIRGGHNSYELSDVPADKMQKYQSIYSHAVHHEIRVKKTKWVVLRYPNPSMAQLAGKSTEAFEDFYFDVCTLDYSKMDRAMDTLKELMERTDKVRIVSPHTDLSFSIKGMPAIKCSGLRNIPDGEVYTAPIKNSVNGIISYNAPSIENSLKHENVTLKFKDGKIIEATSSFTKQLNEILDTDEGARYVGEFAIGVNPFVTEAIGDILFDEKISGSIHFTPGCCYDDAYNGNISAIHWDLVLVQSASFGGGEIYFDDKLIRKDGLFVIEELKNLNPDALK